MCSWRYQTSYVRLLTFTVVRVTHRFSRDLVRAVGPAGEILQLAPVAAEGPPCGVDRLAPAERAKRRLRHHLILVGPHPHSLTRSRRGARVYLEQNVAWGPTPTRCHARAVALACIHNRTSPGAPTP